MHQFLWSKCDRRGELLITQAEVGAVLDIYPMMMSRIFKALAEDGRVRREHRKLFVNNPELWKWDGRVPGEPSG